MSATVVMGKQGRFVVPAGLRSELGLSEGEVLSVQRVGSKLVIERPSDATHTLKGMLSELSRGRSLVEELLAERIDETRTER
ncbi:AbrB/MazE/SpoVT family DNA-binding domain-containing protein [Rhodococcoides kyotonense]|uniref:Looped-hinge helix DNA binding domain-containing protein, AbrB family n=1 Tax=Rhodococcoides kyotonense TaxID=398843 RepID=A0A239M8Q6_9NOCA|nr:AbrB/MazE/SpoVT family DNA-binding domain-containing protein [Rhodococcus kyotonensis]SNT38533.1 looped-hinge helix DNA binding domain-containing protein, AbrB family [Rhodococcus kyotonensis]